MFAEMVCPDSFEIAPNRHAKAFRDLYFRKAIGVVRLVLTEADLKQLMLLINRSLEETKNEERTP